MTTSRELMRIKIFVGVIDNFKKGMNLRHRGVVGPWSQFCKKKRRKENDVSVAHLIFHFCNFLLIDDITLCQLIFLYDDPQLLCLRFVC